MNPLESPSLANGPSAAFASELKFMLARPLAAEVLAWARVNMAPDPHGAGPAGDQYSIHSIYLDTEEFDVLLRNGSFGRGKYRIRRYGGSDLVFLERKMKKHGLVSKKRMTVPLADLARLEGTAPDRQWAGFWFHRRILARQLRPVCQIGYERTARVASSATGTIRLTLDDAISLRPAAGLTFERQLAPVDFSRDQIILELKFRQTLPAPFAKLIEELHLERHPASKYRIASAALGFAAHIPDPGIGPSLYLSS